LSGNPEKNLKTEEDERGRGEGSLSPDPHTQQYLGYFLISLEPQ